MQQYLDLTTNVLENGTQKSAGRDNMPSTLSLFGQIMRFDLSEGFPIVTTKKVSFKNIVVELLWFLQGDTNIKFLVDNGCNIWNEDAYNYYLKKCKEQHVERTISYDLFVRYITIAKDLKELTNDSTLNSSTADPLIPKNYTLGSCGMQYGQLWRNWGKGVDQVKDLLEGLKNNPMSRRHIITAWNPSTLNDMALNACHALAHFNCRPLTWEQKIDWAKKNINPDQFENLYITELAASDRCPQYYLDCLLYQRSADVMLGVPYNIASYALLTEIFALLCNMIPGEFVHTIGDAHIYENHIEAAKEQIKRIPLGNPKLQLNTEHWLTESGECGVGPLSIDGFLEGLKRQHFVQCLLKEDISLSFYVSHPKLQSETKLSTGLK